MQSFFVEFADSLPWHLANDIPSETGKIVKIPWSIVVILSFEFRKSSDDRNEIQCMGRKLIWQISEDVKQQDDYLKTLTTKDTPARQALHEFDKTTSMYSRHNGRGGMVDVPHWRRPWHLQRSMLNGSSPWEEYYYWWWTFHTSCFTSNFLPGIQIRWTNRLAVIPLLAIISQDVFAHATTAQLSCHV